MAAVSVVFNEFIDSHSSEQAATAAHRVFWRQAGGWG